jgi:hypothetical protein
MSVILLKNLPVYYDSGSVWSEQTNSYFIDNHHKDLL